tara:strand:+ start:456 stop:635 length:180 start_codon:yes stop_codon:yes gene_type:complete
MKIGTIKTTEKKTPTPINRVVLEVSDNGGADWTPLDFAQGDESFAETLQELMAEIQEEE